MSNTIRQCRYSAIDWLNKCQLHIRLIYGEGAPEIKHPAGIVGTKCHELLSAYTNHCISTKKATDDEEYGRLANQIRATVPVELESDFVGVVKSIKNTISFQALLDAKEVYVERRLALDGNLEPVEYVEGNVYRFSSGLDLYWIDDDTAYVNDYKTSRLVISNNQADASLQRKTYSWMILKHHPQVNEVQFIFDMSRFGRKTKPHVFTREFDMPEFEERIKEMIKNYDAILNSSERPEANPGPHCIVCGCKAPCPIYKEAFTLEEQVNSISDATRLVRLLYLAEQKIKTMRALAQEAVQAYGEIPIDESSIYTNVPTSTVKYDLTKTLNKLAEMGVPDELITKKVGITGTELKSICKTTKLDLSEFEEYASVSLKNNYKQVPIVKDEDGGDVDDELLYA